VIIGLFPVKTLCANETHERFAIKIYSKSNFLSVALWLWPPFAEFSAAAGISGRKRKFSVQTKPPTLWPARDSAHAAHKTHNLQFGDRKVRARQDALIAAPLPSPAHISWSFPCFGLLICARRLANQY
jgi:hypothetical protein